MYYAEFETDRYIRENFFPDVSYKGVMVEVGAATPHSISMSRHWRETGWRCICIDPNPRFAQEHRVLGHEIYEVACSFDERESTFKIIGDGLSFSALEVRYGGCELLPCQEINVKVRRLDSILEEANVEKVDLLSIDVEGWEVEVMRGFNVNKYQPSVILLENYAHDCKYTEYMASVGYKLSHELYHNYIYTRV